MKQGQASSSGPGSRKIEPRSTAVNPGGVSQIGTSIGNHSDKGASDYTGAQMYEGRGYEAPMAGTKNHGSGSQGKH
jgi:hypothetical protein